MPLSAMITDDITLIGGIDLLLRDENQNLIIVDTKTASKAKTQTDVDNDLQLSGYSHLLVENGYASKSDIILCRLDVLRKLKTPKAGILLYHQESLATQEICSDSSGCIGGN